MKRYFDDVGSWLLCFATVNQRLNNNVKNVKSLFMIYCFVIIILMEEQHGQSLVSGAQIFVIAPIVHVRALTGNAGNQKLN